jgi:hypothetical protein
MKQQVRALRIEGGLRKPITVGYHSLSGLPGGERNLK